MPVLCQKFNTCRSTLYSISKEHFGCGITDDKINDFISYVNTALSDFDFTPCYRVDFIYDITSLSNKDILNIAHFKHIWGSGLEEPLIAIEKLAITP